MQYLAEIVTRLWIFVWK